MHVYISNEIDLLLQFIMCMLCEIGMECHVYYAHSFYDYWHIVF